MPILTYSDPVFDYSGTAHVDLGGLSLLLTAQQLVNRKHHDVWLHGLPEDAWRVLYALGLQDNFRLFPIMIGPME